ncbi:Hypothetical predicted protein [Octopus vulgaris]|uniref:Uncharacterized protein n=1 Tax=Octopus vulgaris TaxID=6645 RepID=A0AA36BMB4_OCTVU|nr:Hypothetical predicted protein [Octopus vulgaris]
MDESTDLSRMSQLHMFIHGVKCNFEIIEEMASICSIHGTTTGEDIFIEAFLEEMDSNFCDLPYYTEVRWLSCGKVLFCFYKLQREIDLFLTEKNRADPQLSEPSWLSKLSFLVDVTSHMNELNLKL